MAKQESCLQLSSQHLIQKSKALKRWLPESAEEDARPYLKTKYRKIDTKIDFHLYDTSQFVLKWHKHSEETNIFILWMHSIYRQKIERPMSLTSLLFPFCPFKIYLKCLPEAYTCLKEAIKHIHSLTDTGQCHVHLKNVSEFHLENITGTNIFNVHYNSKYFEVNPSDHDSDRKLTDKTCIINKFELDTSVFSAMQYLILLYQNLQTSNKKYDVKINELKTSCKKKVYIIKKSEENSQGIPENNKNYHKSSRNLDIREYDEAKKLEIKKQEEILSPKLERLSQNKFVTDNDKLSDLLKNDFSNEVDNSSLNLNVTWKPKESLFLTNINIVKQTRDQLEQKSVTFPFVKFSLDYEEMSGSSEMLLSNIFSNDLPNKEAQTNKNSKAMIDDQCITHFTVSDTQQSNIVAEQKILTDTTSIVFAQKEKTNTNVNYTDAPASFLKQSSINYLDKKTTSELPEKKESPHVFIMEAASENKEILGDSYVVDSESEHVVPEISISEITSMVETSLYEECISIRGLEEKSVFQWNTNSLDLPDISGCDQFSYPSSQMCSRPLRLGLSKKQKVKHLHKKSEM